MQAPLTLLHTSPALISTFDVLIEELAPDIPVRHIVDESLIKEARETGLTTGLVGRVNDRIMEAVKEDARVVLCTCSSIGGCAEQANGLTDIPVIRVDRPMAEKAVSIGSPIIVAATLTSTLVPTKELVLDAAERAKKKVEIVEVVCQRAWTKFEEGDREGYYREIATDLKQAAAKGEVIVLAQASMAGAAALCTDLTVPVLSSPALGLQAAIEAYRR